MQKIDYYQEMVDYRARLDALIEKYKIKPKVHLG